MKRQDGFVAAPHSNHLRQPRGALPFFGDAARAHSPLLDAGSVTSPMHPPPSIPAGVLVRALAKCTCSSADALGRRTNRTVSYVREVAERSQCSGCVYPPVTNVTAGSDTTVSV